MIHAHHTHVAFIIRDGQVLAAESHSAHAQVRATVDCDKMVQCPGAHLFTSCMISYV